MLLWLLCTLWSCIFYVTMVTRVRLERQDLQEHQASQWVQYSSHLLTYQIQYYVQFKYNIQNAVVCHDTCDMVFDIAFAWYCWGVLFDIYWTCTYMLYLYTVHYAIPVSTILSIYMLYTWYTYTWYIHDIWYTILYNIMNMVHYALSWQWHTGLP